ncbi:MAG TPA: NAD(P)H-dependent oxidoreductase [Acidimicrobiales bacterium]|jgi:NAD(P)H-dependent FMN reductase|nr:NAD(P)H-dependent oxidoreductase [Acidimicrobiales bacterium]
MTPTVRVLLVPGSLRQRSTNIAVLRTARSVAPEGVEAELYEGLGDLPHFNPDDDVEPLHPAVADLRRRIRRAGAVLFSTPEYAGALPGSFKNLLDWTIGDAEEGSIYEKPVAWINASPRGAVNAHQSLRQVLGYASAVIVEAACRDVPVTEAALSSDGLVGDPEAVQEIAAALTTLAGAANPGPADGHQP